MPITPVGALVVSPSCVSDIDELLLSPGSLPGRRCGRALEELLLISKSCGGAASMLDPRGEVPRRVVVRIRANHCRPTFARAEASPSLEAHEALSLATDRALEHRGATS